MTDKTASWTIERTGNPKKEKSAGKLFKRIRRFVKSYVKEMTAKEGIKDVFGSKEIIVPKDAKNIAEPTFEHDIKRGRRTIVHPQNRKFLRGDRIPKQPGGSGSGTGGGEPSTGGAQNDDHHFIVDEKLVKELFMEDLELPYMVEKEMKEIKTTRFMRGGYTKTGSPANLSRPRSMRRALLRKRVFKRPSLEEIEELERELSALEEECDLYERKSLLSEKEYSDLRRIRVACKSLREEYERTLYRRKVIPFIREDDLRFRSVVKHHEYRSKAVMFCLMDISGSMGEREKHLAKMFMALMYLFLKKKYYDTVDVVFIAHHSDAKEVSEEEFFYSRETGGTIVSSALNLMRELIEKRYSPRVYNIFVAQASDGDNAGNDSAYCAEILTERVLPICQYFAYIEILPARKAGLVDAPKEEGGSALWNAYRSLQARFGDKFAIARVANETQIFRVFHNLLKKRTAQGVA